MGHGLRGSRAARALAGAGLGVALLTGCGSSDEETAQDRYCEAGESLQTSITALTELNLIAEGTNALKAALADIEDDLDDLKDAANEAAEVEVDALEDAVDDFEDALSSLGDEITTDNVSGVATAVRDVSTAAQAVYLTLADCPE
jgi:chromosome segregation ATPase